MSSTKTKNAPAVETLPIATVNPGEMARVAANVPAGFFRIQNRGQLAVTVSSGGKGGMRFKLAGIPITQVMRWCGYNGYSWDEMRAILSLQGLGECVNDNTVGCQVSSGRQSRHTGADKSHHGSVPSDSEMGKETISALIAMKGAIAEVAAKGREMRRANTVVATAKEGTGKKAKEVPVLFDWRNEFATQFVHSETPAVSESGNRRKKPAGKKAK